MKIVPLTLLTLALALASPARAEPPSDAGLVEAYRAWLDTTGLAGAGGYGRYAEDREAVQALVERIAATRPAFAPRAVGSTWGWYITAEAKVSAGHCTMAAVHLAFETWRNLAARGVLERPVGAALDCQHVTVEATFRPPTASAKPGSKLDVFAFVQRDKSSGVVALEASAPFPHEASKVTRAESAFGLAFEVALLRAHRYALGARVLGPEKVLPAMSDVPLRTDTVSPCWHEPFLFPGVETACALTLPHELDLQCASSGWLAFVLEQLAIQRGGLAVDETRPMALSFTCARGQHGEVRTLSAHEAELTFFAADAQRPTWSQRVPLDTLVDTTQETWRRELFVAERKDAKRVPAAKPEARLAWLGARMPTVASWFGAGLAEADALTELDLPLLAKDLMSSLAKGQPKVSCEARKDAPLLCRATPAVDLTQPNCAALAWALAAGLPHLPKAPFGPRAEVDLDVMCGPGRGRGESVLAQRRVREGRLDVTIAAPAFDEVKPGADCEDYGFGADCEPEGEALPAVPARVYHLGAPIDPAAPGKPRP